MKKQVLVFLLIFLVAIGSYFVLTKVKSGVDDGAEQVTVESPAQVTMLAIDEKKLSKAYHDGNCDQVYASAMSAAESGNSRAQLIVGLCRMRYGDEKEKEKGLMWLVRAADNGESRAARELGVHYMHLGYKAENVELVKKACSYLAAGKAAGDELSINYFMSYGCSEFQ